MHALLGDAFGIWGYETKAAAPFVFSTLPLCYVSSALVMQTQPTKRSHITASVLIRFINVTQPHW